MRLRTKKTNVSGFTLIELLVVISIIGVIASTVLVNMGGMRQSANIAQSRTFAASVQQKIGIDIVAAWDFNDGSGSAVMDSSGLGNNGTISGGGSFIPEAPRGSNISGEYSLNLDGVDDYVTVSNNLTGGLPQITVEAWVKGSQAANLLVATNNAVILHFRGAGFYMVAEDGTVSNYLGWSSAPELNKWIYLVATWDGSTMSLYQNAKRQNSALNWSGGATGKLRSSAAFYIGKYFNTGQPYFKGQVDDVRVYGQALSLAGIRSNYIAGLEKLLAAGRIDENEYVQRASQFNNEYAAAD